MNVETLAERVRAEFDEMPGMTLTVPQASRLFGLDHEMLPRRWSTAGRIGLPAPHRRGATHVAGRVTRAARIRRRESPQRFGR